MTQAFCVGDLVTHARGPCTLNPSSRYERSCIVWIYLYGHVYLLAHIVCWGAGDPRAPCLSVLLCHPTPTIAHCVTLPPPLSHYTHQSVHFSEMHTACIIWANLLQNTQNTNFCNHVTHQRNYVSNLTSQYEQLSSGLEPAWLSG